jgi:uncharacterized protein
MGKEPFFKFESPVIQLFFLFGIFFTCYLLALLVTAAISLSGVPMESIAEAESLSDIFKFNLNDPVFLSKIKWAQLFASILMFLVPPFIFTFLVAPAQAGGRITRYLSMDRSFPMIFALIIPVLMLASLPLINLLAELNANMSLPEFLYDVERWMKKAEEDAKVMTEAFLKMDSTGSLIFNLAMIALAPAFGEELLFRGVVQKLFTRLTKNVHWGIWIAAALFSALHAQFYGFIPRMALGALLGYLLLWSGSLWLPILAHFINNGGAVLVAYLVQRGAISKEVENIGTGKDEIYFILSSAVLVSGLIWMIYKRRRKDGIVEGWNSGRME